MIVVTFGCMDRRDQVAFAILHVGCYQVSMVDHFSKRFFDFGFHKQVDAKVFSSAENWVHFSRLMPFVEVALSELEASHPGTEIVNVKRREFWKGDYDVELGKVSHALPYAVQTNLGLMVSRIKEQLAPLGALMASLTQLPQIAIAPENDADKKTEGASVQQITVGNVSDHIKEFKTMSKGEKLDLAAKLTKQATLDKETHVKRQCYKQACVFACMLLRLIALRICMCSEKESE